MRSRIFQTSKKPVKEEDYITENSYYVEDRIYSIADYVCESDDFRDADIDWLKETLPYFEFGKEGDDVFFVVKNKEKHFETQFSEFQKYIKSISKWTLEDFSKISSEMDFYMMSKSYNDKYGFYFDSEEYGFYSLDECIRLMKEGEKFYIGGIVAYHY